MTFWFPLSLLIHFSLYKKILSNTHKEAKRRYALEEVKNDLLVSSLSSHSFLFVQKDLR